jgi:hypothetical protein
MQWTALDLKNLAVLFDDMADAVWNFRIQNGNALTLVQKNQLTGQFGELVTYGEELENEALQSALFEIDAAVVDLQNAAHDATHALQVISDVQKVVTIAVAAVGLGAAILDPSPGTVASSVSTLVQAVQQANAKPTDGSSSTSSAPPT